MKKICVYRRVSSDGQDTRMQEHAINKWLAEHAPGAAVSIYEDAGYSGKNTKRPEFQRLLADIEAGKVDMVLVYRLDRLSRDAVALMRLLMTWIERGLEFVASDQPLYTLTKDNPMRLTMLAMMADLAQLERETTVKRIKDGLAAAKARGVRLGAKKTVTEKKVAAIRSLLEQGHTYKHISKALGVSQGTIGRARS